MTAAATPPLDASVVRASAPWVLVSPRAGEPAAGRLGGGADGVYAADRRLVAWLEISGGAATLRPEPVFAVLATTGRRLTVQVGTDLADVVDVRRRRPTIAPEMTIVDGGVRWSVADAAVALQAVPPPDQVDVDRPCRDGEATAVAVLRWTQPAPEVRLVLTVQDRGVDPPFAVPVATMPSIGLPNLAALPPALAEAAKRALDDVSGLLLGDPVDPRDAYLAAGAPWYLTLFGRDALWAARMLLPLGTDLAGGTLRALARRQGTRHDPDAEEAPGKIPHEVRRSDSEPVEGLRLPAVYYGTIDATALFVSLLAESWGAGLPEAEVRELLPAAERALGWLAEEVPFDGFLQYRASRPTSLANQGWKDSPEAVAFADGTRAEAPLALCEAQGYAYEAALLGAALLDAFGRPGGAQWRKWAAALSVRFRERFWIDDGSGAYPAVALDRRGRPVDGPASNMGHLPGTGILDEGECALVARRLRTADLDSGWGVRTLSARHAGFDPASYHCGSVWPHDTAIAALGLARAGQHETASRLAGGLCDAAVALGGSLPELWSGLGRDTSPSAPVRHPTACHPQAWAAAGLLAVLPMLFPE